MITSLVVIFLSFIWLLWETDWLRIRLPVGTAPKPELIESREIPKEDRLAKLESISDELRVLIDEYKKEVKDFEEPTR
jgi:hypothetical protein